MSRLFRKYFWNHISLFIILLGVILFNFSQHNIPNLINYAGDTWDYQTLAVNFMKGHGYQSGLCETYETYKFYKTSDPSYTKDWGEYMFYRTPGYPLFLILIYSISGIQPYAVFISQIVFLAIALSSLPWFFGKVLNFGWIGIVSGILSVYYQLNTKIYFKMNAAELYTEVCMMLGYYFFILVSLWALQNFSKKKMFILGVSCGTNLLIKGTFIFVPLLLFIYLLVSIEYWKDKLKLCCLYILGIILIVSPWTIYATYHSKKLVILSTQGSVVLLDGNNELSLKSGKWEPTHTYYQQNRFKGETTLHKYLIFLKEHRTQIIPMVLKKISIILYDLPFPIFIFGFLIILMLSILKNYKILFFQKLYFSIIIFIPLSFIFLHSISFNSKHVWLFFPLFILSFFMKSWQYSLNTFIPFLLLYINIFLLTIILFAERRFFTPFNIILMPFNFLFPFIILKALYHEKFKEKIIRIIRNRH